ncbi:hypothetical protein D9M73_213420 [compost metagenome]
MLGSVAGLFSESLPYWKPLRARMVRTGVDPVNEKSVSARLLRLALTWTEITGWSVETLAKGSSMTTN